MKRRASMPWMRLGGRATFVATTMALAACAQLIGLEEGTPRASTSDPDSTPDRDGMVSEAGDTTAADAGPAAPKTQLALGSNHTCVLLPKGDVKCWGSNAFGQSGGPRGIGTFSPKATRALAFGQNWITTQIVAGSSHTCALSEDHRVKCWGWNLYGQLGVEPDSTMTSVELDEDGDASLVNLGKGAKPIAIAAGYQHTCALLEGPPPEGNVVKCWGSNSMGTLGLESESPARVGAGPDSGPMGDGLGAVHLPPASSTGGPPIAIVAGSHFNCVVRQNNAQVFCWGSNGYNQLGFAKGTNTAIGDEPKEMGSRSPFQPAGSRALSLTAHAIGRHVCAQLSDGVVCWGDNTFGQAGTPGTDGEQNAAIRKRVDFGLDASTPAIASVAAGSYHACATFVGGDVRCWGSNSEGAVGVEGAAAIVDGGRVPVAPSEGLVNLGTGVLAARVFAGRSHTCVVTTDDRVKCWGNNNSGQLGTGDTVNRGGTAGKMGDALPFVEFD